MREDNDDIIGADPVLLAALALARRVAPTRMPVLVGGESGTGKELVARLIHRNGPTPRGPMVAVNCGTLPRELADSELFGHERGAFTGAGMRKRGWFEEAHGGTLVLDEIGELPLDLQPKLLRVLETGRLRRVGGAGEIAVDVRVVALTLRELRRDVEQRRFRLDLFHRVAAVEVVLPPLRRRRGDIPRLVTRFLSELRARPDDREGAAGDRGGHHEPLPPTITSGAIEALVRQDWPGNVRELRNVVRRAAVLGGSVIDVEALGLDPGPANRSAPLTNALFAPDSLRELAGNEPPRLADAEAAATEAAPWQGGFAGPAEPRETRGAAAADLLCLTGRTFDNIERAVLTWALARNGGSRRRAARALGMPRSTFCDKVRRFATPN